MIDTNWRVAEDAPVFNQPLRNHAMHTTPIRKDTTGWKLQLWVSIGLAVLLCGCGLAYLPGGDLGRTFMVMGYMFCLSTAFALAKFVHDNESRRSCNAPDTPMWSLVVWGGFALALGLTAWRLWRMDVNATYKAFLGASWLFLISTTFTLAKTLRDAHEALIGEARAQGMAMRDGVEAR